MRIALPLLLAACTHPAPPAFPTGDVHDFDEFAGAWKFANKRLDKRGVGSHTFDEFPAYSCTTTYLGGIANVDEVTFPTKGWGGLTVRTFDIAKHRWSIYWVNTRTGVMFPPVVGGFTGAIGEFYGDDDDDGKPVKVRFRWTKHDRDHLTWEQSFSYDGGTTWEMNWTNDLERDAPSGCVNGRPAPR